MKVYAATLAALTVTTMVGCGAPASQVAAPILGSATAPAGPAALNQRKPLSYTMGAYAANDRVVVRYKDDRKIERTSFGVITRSLGLERTHVYTVRNAEERDTLIAELKQNPNVEIAEPDYTMQAYGLSNDPQVSEQWGLSKIDLAGAWGVTKGSADVTVAVVDTGVDYNHPDLAGRITKGYDFANNDADPMDDHGHGTHGAGTIVANTDNGQGIAGMTSGTKVLAVKVLASDGSGETSAIANGITYAVKQGAQVISLSLGGPGESQVLKSAVDEAVKAGVVVVAAAGNEGNTRVNYPAGYDDVIAVGATDAGDRRTSFSTYGSWVDIAAPGDKIVSTVLNGKYEEMSGTSMAAPYVAAGAALVLAKNPTNSVNQVRQALVSTGDTSSGFETSPELRRMNIARALGAESAPAQPSPGSSEPSPPQGPGAPEHPPTPGQVPGHPTPRPGTPAERLMIGGIGADVSATAATIHWTTAHPAMGMVEYGTTRHLSQRAIASQFSTQGSVTLSGLSPHTTYYYRVSARDAAGGTGSSYLTVFRTRAR